MKNKHLLSSAILLTATLSLNAQDAPPSQDAVIPLARNSMSQQLVERLEILGQTTEGKLHTTAQPLTLGTVGKAWLGSTDDSDTDDSNYLANELSPFLSTPVVSKKPILKYFYKSPAYLFEVKVPHFGMSINPLLNISAGSERVNGVNKLIFDNQRGVELAGHVDDRVYFRLNILESQSIFNSYVTQRIERQPHAIPGAGYYKFYNSRLTNSNNDGYDYMVARGTVGFRATKHISVLFGHDSHFIGDGHRSLFLSDYSAPYFFLKLQTRVWRLNYQNIFAELTADHYPGGAQQPDGLRPKKYMAAHHLTFDAGKGLHFGLFETVMFGRDRGFELQYLNPLMLYRTVEHAVGSPDNVLLGANAKYNFLKHCQVYGQVILDEFNFNQLLKNNGWWANKYGVQIGMKYYNAFGVKNLDLQAEYNTVRPYTYTHNDSLANYTHYNQPLAHPLGANFQEFIFKLRYRPIPALVISGQLNYARYGLDQNNINYGGDIFIPSTQRRPDDFGNNTGQGVDTKTLYARVMASYMIRHNINFDLTFLYRKQQSSIPSQESTMTSFSAGLRWNLPVRNLDF